MLRHLEGDPHGAVVALEDSLRVLTGTDATPRPPLAMPYLTAAEWRLGAGNAHAADSLALLGRAAAAIDSLALQRSAFVGRAELVHARARLALGDHTAARAAAERAVTAMNIGYGADNQRTRDARALRDSIPD